MVPDGAVGEEFVTLEDDFTKRREVKRIDYLKACGELPGEKKADYADNAEPVEDKFTGTLP
jgi:hypothetical protein